MENNYKNQPFAGTPYLENVYAASLTTSGLLGSSSVAFANADVPRIWRYVLPVAEGDVILSMPADLSAESRSEIDDWIELIGRKLSNGR